MSLRTESKLISLTSDTASQYNNSTFLSNVLYFLPGLLGSGTYCPCEVTISRAVN